MSLLSMPTNSPFSRCIQVARLLLTAGQAAVLKRYPFTIVLKKAIDTPQLQPLRLKLDPGAKVTGIALVNDASGQVIFAAELVHRGPVIKAALDSRRAVRRSRRARHTRYRKPRSDNRRRPKGWMPPSLESRISNVLTWATRLQRLCPLQAISLELVRFDLQKMEHPEISGVAYHQGSLYGYEIREYLMEKWQHACAYCGKQHTPLQVEHIVPRAKGGTDRLSNLCIACDSCNSAKGTQEVSVFLGKKPALLARILAQATSSLTDAAAVNTTRWALYEQLKTLGLPVECGSGGLTKFNRTRRGMAKSHWADAANVGSSTPERLEVQGVTPVLITAKGHGCRQRCNVDTYGFPCFRPKGAKKVHGFQTGDIVRAVVTTGKKRGSYVGRVLVRTTGSFDLTMKQGRVAGLNHRFCTPLHRSDGYMYAQGGGHFSLP